MNYYLDTSALIKLYHPEEGSANLEEYLEAVDEALFLIIAGIAPLEFRSAFYRRVRIGELTPEKMSDIVRRFQKDLQYLETVTLSNWLLEDAIDLMDRVAGTKSLRTLDALQLASALVYHQTIPIDVFIAADTNLLQVAGKYFPTYNPLDS